MEDSVRLRSALSVAVPLACLAVGCGTPWAIHDQYSWKIVAPAKVARAADLPFHVEASSKDGQEARELKFRYVVDWSDIKGSRHTGETFVPQLIRVKGNPGKALLRVYAYDANEALHQVAQHEFEVY